MARRPNVRWSESAQRWMAWVRFPDGSRRKVERTNRTDAQRDLDALLAVRDGAADVGPSRQRLATFADVLDRWVEAGCPRVSPGQKTRHARDKAPNTLDNAKGLLATHVRPAIGVLRVDRTTTERLEVVFQAMAAKDYATSTIDRTWAYLNAGRDGRGTPRCHRGAAARAPRRSSRCARPRGATTWRAALAMAMSW